MVLLFVRFDYASISHDKPQAHLLPGRSNNGSSPQGACGCLLGARMNYSDLTNEQLAAMLLGYAIGNRDLTPLADAVAERLIADSAPRTDADRAKAYRARKLAKVAGTVTARHDFRDEIVTKCDASVTIRDGSVTGEGGRGGEGSKSEMPFLSQNQGIKANTQGIQSLSQPEVRPVRVTARHENVTDGVTHVQTDSRGWTRGFARFFDAYPPAERKRDCARKWVTMGLEPETDRIIGGLELWKMCERWQTGFVLGMRDWLENRKWEDAPPAVKIKTAAPEPKKPRYTAEDIARICAEGEAEDARKGKRC